jgi:aspartate aminotransferase
MLCKLVCNGAASLWYCSEWVNKRLASAVLDVDGMATIGGPDFGVHGEGYIRLSYANSLENIEKALGRIRVFLDAKRPG